MPAPTLTLSQIRQSQVNDYRDLGRRILRKGVGDLTTEEVRYYEELHQFSDTGQFVQGVSDQQLNKTEAQRIETMREKIGRGEPPFNTTTAHWAWDAKNREFHWNSDRFFPKDLIGDTSQLVFKPKYSNGENPFARYLEQDKPPVR